MCLKSNFIFPKLHLIWEIWKWNEDFGVYVSTMGRFKDVNKKDLQIKTGDKNYLYVETSQGLRLIHRVVMITFKPIEGFEHITVDHLDHNPRNNALYNLEWCTEKENKRRGERDKVSNKNDLKSAKLSKHYLCVDLNKSFDTNEELIDFVHRMKPASKNIKDGAIINGIDYAIKHGTRAYTYKWKRTI
jgi:hypothetical protein